MHYPQQLEDILSVVLQESNLFTDDEIQMLILYRSLPHEVQLLFFYLLQRIKDVRFAQVETYSDRIPAWKDAVDMLIECNLLTLNKVLSVQDGLDMLKKDELSELAKRRRLNIKYSNRQTEINFGSTCVKPCARMLNDIHQYVGDIIRVPRNVKQVFTKLSVIYSREQSIPDNPFLNSILTNLLSEEKKRCFPDYKIQRLTGLLWSTREDFCKYYMTLEWEMNCRSLESDKNWKELAAFCESLREDWSDSISNYEDHVTGISWLKVYQPGHVLTRIMEFGFRAYFRLKEYQIQADLLQNLISQNIFMIEHKGFWYDELTKIMDLYLSKTQARQLCLDALSDKNVIARRRLAITNRAKKLFKNDDMLLDHQLQDVNSDSFPKATLLAHKVPGGTSGSKALYLDSITSNLVSVEELALAHYISKGWKGVHSENSVMKTLFGLLFWDILFMDLPGVFVSPYQNAPLDLGFSCFYEARREQIESRIEFIANGNAMELICKVHERDRSKGTSCIGIDWYNFTATDLCEIASCLGPEALSFICNRFAKSYKVYGGGMPDLCLWKTESQEIKFIEVKGPGDRLSEKQLLWMNDLLSLGVGVELLLVQVLNNE